MKVSSLVAKLNSELKRIGAKKRYNDHYLKIDFGSGEELQGLNISQAAQDILHDEYVARCQNAHYGFDA